MNDMIIELASQRKAKPQDENSLGFGKVFTDHMFAMEYIEGEGWHNPRIVPYSPITLDPAVTCLHYGQMIFEGMKAYRTKDNRVVMFRPYDNMKRFNRSAARFCMPSIDVDFMVEALTKLVDTDRDWVPSAPGTSLYIRPFMFSTEVALGVHPSNRYLLLIIMSPSGVYYKSGLSPVRIYVEQEYVRTVQGGTGFAKCAGNYAASLIGQAKADEQGYAQVLWLDGKEKKYVDEVGSMNIFFKINGKVVTPALTDSILAGITRDSVIQMLKSWNVPVEERPIEMQEIADAYADGKLEEAFGTGTAAVVSPIGELTWGDLVMQINNGEIGTISQRLYQSLTAIQLCDSEDPFQWVHEV